MKKTALINSLAALAIFSSGANANVISVAAGSLGQCPTVGSAGSCAAVYQFNGDGSVDTLVDSSVPSTDSIEDTLIGIQNNSGHTLNSLSLDGMGLGIFGFENDGQSTVANPGTGPGDTYFGHYFDSKGVLLGTTSFSGINSAQDKGTIDFAGLLNGGYGWFVLEDQISFNAPPVVSSVPLPGAIWLFGSAIVGFAGFGRRKSI